MEEGSKAVIFRQIKAKLIAVKMLGCGQIAVVIEDVVGLEGQIFLQHG